jgi:N-acetylglutamate synthase-like GNAT family acetyltransferase
MDIVYLADHLELVPQLAAWFHAEWAYLYPERTLAQVEAGIRGRAEKDRLPLALVALEDHTLRGTVCLKIHDMDTRTELSPWLAGLFVDPAQRRRGLGTALVRAMEDQALSMGIHHLYLYTPVSEQFYRARGWRMLEHTDYHGYPVTIMQKTLTS